MTAKAHRLRAANLALNLFPDMVKLKAADNPKFRHEHRLSVEAFMGIGHPDGEFRRTDFCGAVRSCYKTSQKLTLRSCSGKAWNVGLETVGSETRFALRRDNFGILLPDFYSLDGNRTRRMARFKEEVAATNLPADARARWARVLSRRALHDDEQALMESDFLHTPLRMIGRIGDGLRNADLSIYQGVPDQEVYYERLVGRDAQSDNIDDYAGAEVERHITQLIDWDSTRGAQLALLLAGQRSIIAAAADDVIDRIDLDALLDWALGHGDPLSRLGALELGFRRLRTQPQLAMPLARLLKSLLDEDAASPTGALSILSACFMLAEGELSRSRALKNWLPFRHRLASLAHAAMMTQQLMQWGKTEKFVDWAIHERAYPFYCKSLIDLRLEPKWLPELASAEQFHADIIGRVLLCRDAFGNDVPDGDLKALLFEQGNGGLLDKLTLSSFWPGPLEGASRNKAELPDDIAQLIRKHLTDETVTAMSFVSLVNSRSPFAIDPDYIDLAISSIKRANHRLNSEDTTILAAALFGLAALAASERRPDLAEELRIVARHNRHHGINQISLRQEHKIALTAAAAHADVEAWGRFFGDWSLELCYQTMSSEQARDLLDEVIQLCRICPNLSHFLARSRAALNSLSQLPVLSGSSLSV